MAKKKKIGSKLIKDLQATNVHPQEIAKVLAIILKHRSYIKDDGTEEEYELTEDQIEFIEELRTDYFYVNRNASVSKDELESSVNNVDELLKLLKTLITTNRLSKYDNEVEGIINNYNLKYDVLGVNKSLTFRELSKNILKIIFDKRA